MNTYRLVCVKEPFPIDSKDKKIIKERHSWYVFCVQHLEWLAERQQTKAAYRWNCELLDPDVGTVYVRSAREILEKKGTGFEAFFCAIHLGGFFSGKKGAKIKPMHLKKYIDEVPTFVFERELAEAAVFSQKETKAKNFKKLLKSWLSEVVSIEVQSLSK